VGHLDCVRESQVGQLRAEKASEMSSSTQRSTNSPQRAELEIVSKVRKMHGPGHAAGLENKKSRLLSVLMILPSSHVSVHSKYAPVLVTVGPIARRPTAAERFQRY